MNVKGVITYIVYRNEVNGYTVGKLSLKEKYDNIDSRSITFVGTFGDIKVKDSFEFTGNFITHNSYGKQFAVESYTYLVPSKNEELVSFLSSKLFPIGEVTAKKIVDKFGKDTLKVIEEDCNKLLTIPRITTSKAQKIKDVVISYKSTNDIVLKLSKMGFSTKEAINITYKYNTGSLDYINNNIYDLIEDMKFKYHDIDDIAIKNGMDKLDDRRIKALIIYIIKELCFISGDMYVNTQSIYNEILKYINNLDISVLEYNIISLQKEKRIIILDSKIYLKSYYEEEVNIARRINYINKQAKTKIKGFYKEIERLECKYKIKYDDSQIEAIKVALISNISIITGGPGTGKTTIVKAIVALIINKLKIKKEDIVLLSPTGKASKRLTESVGVNAYTIHKFLEWDKDNDIFKVGIYNKKKCKYIIIDEVSMIDTNLISALFDGTLNTCKFILVGDYNQLPSITKGQVLKDLIDANTINVIRLDVLHRQNNDSYIPLLAREIKDKRISDNFINKTNDYNFIQCPSNYILPCIKSIILKAKEKGYTDKDIQLLAPMYKTLNGIDNLNNIVRDIFNPGNYNKDEISIAGVIYRVGDKVLQLVNDAENNVYNGDIGYIYEINERTSDTRSNIVINFDGNKVMYTPDKYINFTHGYAISVHKSQGGEYKMVIMPICDSFKRMLYNKLIYTAVTRAKQTLLLVGSTESFLYAVNNENQERKTSLKEFLHLEYKKNK